VLLVKAAGLYYIKMILVTGASGYIATHVVQQLQQLGHQVRGTVRSLENEVKVQPLRNLCPDAKYPLELVEADLLDEESLERAVDGCEYVIHTASPFPANNPLTIDELVVPAVNGTLGVLKACRNHGVKRVVLTSSTVAIHGPMLQLEDGKTYTEEDWPKPMDNVSQAYAISKTKAEKAAWDFVASLPEKERFELAVINPCLVIGPVLCGQPGTSAAMVAGWLKANKPGPKMCMGFVDVRDVATAHIKAMTVPEAAGHRHLACGVTTWLSDAVEILREEFKGTYTTTEKCPDLDGTMKMIFSGMDLPFFNKMIVLDNTRLRTVLGIKPIELRQQLVDTVNSLIEKGCVCEL